MAGKVQNANIIKNTCMLSCFSHVSLCVTLGTVACQAPLSMGFSRQEYWGGLPHPSPGDLPDPGIKPTSLSLQVDSLLQSLLGSSKMGAREDAHLPDPHLSLIFS